MLIWRSKETRQLSPSLRTTKILVMMIWVRVFLQTEILKGIWFTFGYAYRSHRKRPWCWERLKAGGKGDDRGWDGWMASQTQWTWVWVSSRRRWWTGKPGVLQFMGSQRVGHNWATDLNYRLYKHENSGDEIIYISRFCLYQLSEL